MSDYVIKKPGDVLYLREDLLNVNAGHWVLLSIDVIYCLSLVGQDDDGQMCATSMQIYVSAKELALFEPTGLNIAVLGAA